MEQALHYQGATEDECMCCATVAMDTEKTEMKSLNDFMKGLKKANPTMKTRAPKCKRHKTWNESMTCDSVGTSGIAWGMLG